MLHACRVCLCGQCACGRGRMCAPCLRHMQMPAHTPHRHAHTQAQWTHPHHTSTQVHVHTLHTHPQCTVHSPGVCTRTHHIPHARDAHAYVRAVGAHVSRNDPPHAHRHVYLTHTRTTFTPTSPTRTCAQIASLHPHPRPRSASCIHRTPAYVPTWNHTTARPHARHVHVHASVNVGMKCP